MTSNEKYGGLNRRFDKRAKRLIRAGFRYEHTEYGGMFCKRRGGRVRALAASLVMHVDNWAFWDSLGWMGWRKEGVRHA